MAGKYVLSVREESLFIITLNRPEKLNALNESMRGELLAALDSAAESDARAVIVTGAGRAFCSGGDIGYMAELRSNNDVDRFRLLLELGRRVIAKLRSMEKPVIAAVNGPAAGAGMNLALACDIRIASDRASFTASFTRIGLHPDWGGTYFLPRAIGLASANELIFSAATIDAHEAERIGLVNRVVSHEKLMPSVKELAAKIAENAPTAIALAKRSMQQNLHRDLESALAAEFEAQIRCFLSQDAEEGFAAFLEKRAPTFKGK